MLKTGCSEDPDVKGTETSLSLPYDKFTVSCSEDPDVKGTETFLTQTVTPPYQVAARIPM